MPRRVLIVLAALAVLGAAAVLVWRRDHGAPHYTGVVEGEERVIRSEVAGRVLEVLFAEGDAVPAGAVLARLDDRDIAASIAASEQSLRVMDAEIRRQEQQVATSASIWTQDVSARRAELRQADAAATLAESTFARERELIRSGASTQQLLDEARADYERALALRAAADATTTEIATGRTPDTGDSLDDTRPSVQRLEHTERVTPPPDGWGPAGFQERVAQAWTAFMRPVNDPAAPWLRVRSASGTQAALDALQALLDGKVNARDGLMLSL